MAKIKHRNVGGINFRILKNGIVDSVAIRFIGGIVQFHKFMIRSYDLIRYLMPDRFLWWTLVRSPHMDFHRNSVITFFSLFVFDLKIVVRDFYQLCVEHTKCRPKFEP